MIKIKYSTFMLNRKILTTLIIVLFFVNTAVSASQLVVLQYHHVSEETPFSTSISADKFAKHMQFLKDNQFNVVSLSDAIKLVQQGETLPDKSVAISFDDGYKNIYQNGLPILQAFDYPFSVFINTEPVEQNIAAFMDWDELKTLQQHKGELLNHGHSHASMLPETGETDAQWKARIKESITRAQSILNEKLGIKDKLLAYPYGEFNLALENLVLALGFIGFGQHSGAINQYSSITRLPRFPASGPYANLKTLEPKLNSLALAAAYKQGEESWIADSEQSQSVLQIALQPNDFHSSMLGCFYNSQNIKPQKIGDDFLITVELEKASIRERINCTAPSIKHDGARYYWWSHPYFYRN